MSNAKKSLVQNDSQEGAQKETGGKISPPLAESTRFSN